MYTKTKPSLKQCCCTDYWLSGVKSVKGITVTGNRFSGGTPIGISNCTEIKNENNLPNMKE